MTMHILHLTFNIRDICRARAIFFVKAPSSERSAFMMWIVDGRFARHIMSMHSRPLKYLHDVDSNGRCLRISYYPHFVMKNVNAGQ
jgi:hypothetical protein